MAELPDRSPSRSRKRTNDGAVGSSSLEELLATLQTNVTADIKTEMGKRVDSAVDAMDAKFQSQTAALLRKYDISVQSRFDEQHAALDETNEKLGKTIVDTRAMRKDIDAMQKILASPPAPPSPRSVASSTGSFADRPADPSVLKVTATTHVLKQEVIAVLDAWLEEAAIDKQFYKIQGDTLGRYFSIKFEGDHGTDLRRLQQAFGTLRSRTGEWRKFAVDGPSGSKINLFIGKDKSKAQVRSEIGVKRLFEVVQQALPLEPSAVHLLRRDKQVAYKWQPMVRLDMDGDAFKLKWNGPVVTAAGVDRVAIETAFRTAMGATTRSQIEWSI